MQNPFELLDARLTSIENLLAEISSNKKENTNTKREEEFLVIKEAADFLSLKVSTLYHKVHKREIPFMKKGNRLYFSKIELLEYVKKGRISTIIECEDEASQYFQKNHSSKKLS